MQKAMYRYYCHFPGHEFI